MEALLRSGLSALNGNVEVMPSLVACPNLLGKRTPDCSIDSNHMVRFVSRSDTHNLHLGVS